MQIPGAYSALILKVRHGCTCIHSCAFEQAVCSNVSILQKDSQRELDMQDFAPRCSQHALTQTSNISRFSEFSVKAIVGLMVLLPVVAAHAEAQLEVFRDSPQFVGLAPGESGSMTIAIHNHGPDAAAHVQIGAFTFFAFSPYFSYPMQIPAQPQCGSLMPGGPFGLQGQNFGVGPIGSGQTVHCVIQITRNPTALNSTYFDWQVMDFADDPGHLYSNVASFSVGSLTDIALSVEPINFALDHGVAHALVRLHASNRGAGDVAQFSVGACTDNAPPPFSINGNIPDGCGSSGYGPTCFDYGLGFRIAALPAGQDMSCNIALTGTSAYVGPTQFAISMHGTLTDPVTGGSLIDTNFSNDTVSLVLAAASMVPAQIPSSTLSTQILTGLGLFASALYMTRARRRHR